MQEQNPPTQDGMMIHEERNINGLRYLLSNRRELMSVDFICAVFADPEVYWATPTEPAVVQLLLKNSITFGVFLIKPSVGSTTSNDVERSEGSTPATPAALEQVAMARLITDCVTFGWLTDVIVSKEHRGGGIGGWMTMAMRRWLGSLPAFRRIGLLANPAGHAAAMYSRELGAQYYESTAATTTAVYMSTKIPVIED